MNTAVNFTPLQLSRGMKSGKYVETELGIEQRCPSCGTYWPADSEFFYIKGNGLSSHCKACFRERTGRLGHRKYGGVE